MDPGPGKAATRAKGGSQGAQCSVLCRWQRPQPSAAPAPASSELEPFEALEPGEGDGIWLGTTGTMCCMYSTCHAAHTPRHCNSKGAALRCAPLRSAALRCGASSKETRRLSIGLGRSAWEQSSDCSIPVLGLLGPRHPPSSWRSPQRRDALRRLSPKVEGPRPGPSSPREKRELETLGLPTLLWSLLGVGPSSCESPRKP